MLQLAAGQLVYLAVIDAIAGLAGLGFFFAQAAVAVFMLETVGYIEHYGLLRQKLPNGRWSPVTVTHSWDVYHRFSNYLEFHLQRHADHHTAPARPHELLRLSPQAPQLPAGYPVMIVLAMIPPLWRAVVDPRLPADDAPPPGSDQAAA
jgi:alkane 1-monooxygenase